MTVMNDLLRLLRTYVLDEIETWPEDARTEALERIDQGQFRIDNEIVEDYDDEHWGLNYVVDVLMNDGRIVRVARVQASKITGVDPQLLDATEQEPPDDPSSLVDPPG